MRDSTPANELEQIRRTHLTAESNIKVIGALMMLGALSVLRLGLTVAGSDAFALLMAVLLAATLGLGGFWLVQLDVRGRGVYTGLMIIFAITMPIAIAAGK
ncbi:MAG: hypothetical protein KC457_36200, partial [Myxococcales bacterium]|nr:hypothetical protein [Myxococcales bacterium]